MTDPVVEFLRICSETLPTPEPIYEFGSLQVLGQEGYADMRCLFSNKRYVGADIREGPGVDTILDLHNIDLPEKSVGTAIILNTLEHVERPWTALEQVHRVLIPDGTIIVSVPFKSRIHDFPSDYWRFTPECLKNLLRVFPNSFVSWAGDESRPHTVVGIGYSRRFILPQQFYSEIEAWRLRWRYSDHRPRSLLEKWRRKLIKSGKKRLVAVQGILRFRKAAYSNIGQGENQTGDNSRP